MGWHAGTLITSPRSAAAPFLPAYNGCSVAVHLPFAAPWRRGALQECTAALAGLGATVVLGVRNSAKAAETMERIR